MDLIEALKVIREECKKHTNCETCHLRDYDGGGCCITRTPENWELSCDDDVQKKVPRLFA